MHYLASPVTSMVLLLTLGGASDVKEPLERAEVKRAVVSSTQEIEVPAEAAGKLVAVEVRDGDLVESGDFVAQIDDREAQMKKEAAEIQWKAARTQAESRIPEIYARASKAVAEAELDESQAANRKVTGTVPKVTIRRLELSVEEAGLLIEKNILDRKVAEMNADVHEADVKAAVEDINRRRIKSVLDGEVVELIREAGEWVQAGETIMRIMRMDTLRVEGLLDSSQFDPPEIKGKSVSVRAQLARGRSTDFRGTVVFVDPVLRAKGKFLVRAEVENKKSEGSWVLKPGMEAKLTIEVR